MRTVRNSSRLREGGVPVPGGVYLVPGYLVWGVPGPGGTWSGGVPGLRGCTWSRGVYLV